jgi:hypothetical protein
MSSITAFSSAVTRSPPKPRKLPSVDALTRQFVGEIESELLGCGNLPLEKTKAVEEGCSAAFYKVVCRGFLGGDLV